MIVGREILKAWFVTGAKPTEEQFADLIDSMINHSDDQVLLSSGKILQVRDALDGNSPSMPSDVAFGEMFLQLGTKNMLIYTDTGGAPLVVTQEMPEGTPAIVKDKDYNLYICKTDGWGTPVRAVAEIQDVAITMESPSILTFTPNIIATPGIENITLDFTPSLESLETTPNLIAKMEVWASQPLRYYDEEMESYVNLKPIYKKIAELDSTFLTGDSIKEKYESAFGLPPYHGGGLNGIPVSFIVRLVVTNINDNSFVKSVPIEKTAVGAI